jgi:hypothetical protein
MYSVLYPVPRVRSSCVRVDYLGGCLRQRRGSCVVPGLSVCRCASLASPRMTEKNTHPRNPRDKGIAFISQATILPKRCSLLVATAVRAQAEEAMVRVSVILVQWGGQG